MGLDIGISYRDKNGIDVSVELEYAYSLLGSLDGSMAFWSLPQIREIGIKRLAVLGECSPIFFWGWEGLEELGHEIDLLSKNLSTIEFDAKSKVEWLSNLTCCYHMLKEKAPKDSRPCVCIG